MSFTLQLYSVLLLVFADRDYYTSIMIYKAGWSLSAIIMCCYYLYYARVAVRVSNTTSCDIICGSFMVNLLVGA